MKITRFIKEEIAKVANEPGIYAFFNRSQGIIYVGTSEVLRHRLQSYYQQDDFNAHPTKEELREKIAYFYVEYMPMARARKLEADVKCKLEYNFR
jgi:excinuclease UvrABC nuclease subunit